MIIIFEQMSQKGHYWIFFKITLKSVLKILLNLSNQTKLNIFYLPNSNHEIHNFFKLMESAPKLS